MAETYAEIEEPLFLDEPPDLPKRVVRNEVDLDALFALEEEPRVASLGSHSGTILFADSPAPQQDLRGPVLVGLILIGIAAGFTLALTLLR